MDPVDWPDALERAAKLGAPTAVLQLLDRHNRDCAAIAARLGIPHFVAPNDLPGTPFECVPVQRRKRWRETALWWPEAGTLVVAEALGTNRYFTGGRAPVGVHFLLRLTPPKTLGSHDPEHLLTGHGEGRHGPATPAEIKRALAESRRRFPGVLVRLPFSGKASSGAGAGE